MSIDFDAINRRHTTQRKVEDDPYFLKVRRKLPKPESYKGAKPADDYFTHEDKKTKKQP